MISPNDEKEFEKIAYNDYSLSRKIPKTIVDYLFDKCPDLWKLLKYSQEPLSQKDLTDSEKKNMICKTSFNTEEFNILFQKYTVNAMIKAKSQVRIFIDDITSYGRTNALVRIIFQIVVNNNEMIINRIVHHHISFSHFKIITSKFVRITPNSTEAPSSAA